MESCAICLEASDELHRVCNTCRIFCHSECFHQWCITDEALVLQDFQYQNLGDGLKDFTQQSSRCFVCQQRPLRVTWDTLWISLIRTAIVTHIGWLLNCALLVGAFGVTILSMSDYLSVGLFFSSWAFSTFACIDHLLFVWKRIRVYKL